MFSPATEGLQPAQVPGVAFRHTVGEADTDALWAVHTGRALHDRVDPLATVGELPRREDVAEMLARVVAAGQCDRVLVAEANGQVIGYNRVTDWRELDGMRVYLLPGWVLPAWRGRGIGTAMIRWAEARARVASASDYPGERFEFAANASSTEAEAAALLHHEGYYVAYTVLEMEWAPRRLVATPLPAGLALKPPRPEHLQPLAESVYECYRDAWPGGRFSEEPDVPEFVASLSAAEHDTSLWRVAWEGDQIAGQVLSKIVKNRAEVFEVSVRHAWRRQGLARALLTSALTELVERRPEAIRLHTVAEFATRARDLYTSVGFQVLKEYGRYRKCAD